MNRPSRTVGVLTVASLSVSMFAPAVSAAAAPAPMRATVVDKAGDVRVQTKGDPFLPSVDVTSAKVVYVPAAKTVRATVRFKDLKPVKTPTRYYKQWISLQFGSVTEHVIGLERNPFHGNKVRVFYGDGTLPCKGAKSVVDVRANKVTMTIPSKCITSSRTRVRFTVFTNAERAFLSADGPAVGTDRTSRSAPMRIG